MSILTSLDLNLIIHKSRAALHFLTLFCFCKECDKIDYGDNMVKIGQYNTFIVNRKTDIGYMLDSQDEQVFLHINESMHTELNSGDELTAFVYIDGQGRTAATLAKALLTVDKPTFLVVKEINPALGIFLEMGISKDLLLSKEDLPQNLEQWPQVGNKLFVTLRVKGKMVAKRVTSSDYDNPENKLDVKQAYEAYVHRFIKDGIQVITENNVFVFVHNSQYKEQYRLGDKVEVKIIYESDKGYSGSLMPQKEEQMLFDANKIYAYLLKVDAMAITSNSTPEDIYATFKMSKKAFKRAIGHLYKERKILFDDEKTWVIA